ncbi:MAG: hypothetical protein Q4D98_08100 [Planctomycetia bacterium]|nr:hypothetical protein [Planctomycetia bacterium]
MRKLVSIGLLVGTCFWGNVWGEEPAIPCLNPEHPMRIPAMVEGKLMPREIGCWFPRLWEAEEPEGYKPFLDAIGNRAAFDLVAVSSRSSQHESISPEALEFQQNAARYAAEKYGILMLPDAEIRLSRKAFEAAYPKRNLCRLMFAETEQAAGKTVSVVLNDRDLTDHYTSRLKYPYHVLGVTLAKAWSFRRTPDGKIDSQSVRDVTADVTFLTEKDKPSWCQCLFDGTKATEDRSLCVAVKFVFLYPDVHSDEALAFERKIFESHASFPAGGCVKDEWGFLPCHDPDPWRTFFWYSDTMVQRYAEQTGRDLLDDAFLMHAAQSDRDTERIRVIDDFNQMNFRQLLRFEQQLYELTKKQWGPAAMPATHPTWHSYPNPQEFRKNSLFWWRHPRDFAQTDETTPFPCRLGMSKREGRVWYNEYYADGISPYIQEEWACVAGGGKVNIHPFCCASSQSLRTPENFGMLPILDAGVDAARAKIRLLNFACDAPLFSPVAVVFGHWGCINWGRPEYDSLARPLYACYFLARRGFPTDLVSSAEAQEKTLSDAPCWTIGPHGFLQYGAQEYPLVVFYAETDSDRADFEHLRKLNRNGKTRIVTLAANAGDAQVAEVLEAGMEASKLSQIAATQSPWVDVSKRDKGATPPCLPAMEAFSRRLDGSLVWTRASLESPAGLPIHLDKETVVSNDRSQTFTISADANGVFACRFDASGKLEALVAAGLTRFHGGPDAFALELSEPVDLALWKNAEGKWLGIYQATENRLPKALRALPVSWRFLEKPQF